VLISNCSTWGFSRSLLLCSCARQGYCGATDLIAAGSLKSCSSLNCRKGLTCYESYPVVKRLERFETNYGPWARSGLYRR